MKKLLNSLIKVSSQIRYPLACAIHEIAKIVGQGETDFLFDIIKMMIKDKENFVQKGVLKNIGKFMQIVKQDKREELIHIFSQINVSFFMFMNSFFKIIENPKWNIRLLFAKQIGILS
jgi:hypothetical protein